MTQTAPAISIYTEHDLAHQDALVRYAKQAYTLLVDWFGEPKDAGWPCVLVSLPHKTAGLGRDRLAREYLICLPSDHTSLEQDCAAMFHEMYHRVTVLCPGLRRLVWVDELLASTVTHHLLDELGFSDYATYRDTLCQSSSRPSIANIVRCRKRRFLPGIFGHGYPQDFGSGLAVLRRDLEVCLSREQIFHLASCRDWKQWGTGLSRDQRDHVSQLIPRVAPFLD